MNGTSHIKYLINQIIFPVILMLFYSSCRLCVLPLTVVWTLGHGIIYSNESVKYIPPFFQSIHLPSHQYLFTHIYNFHVTLIQYRTEVL